MLIYVTVAFQALLLKALEIWMLRLPLRSICVTQSTHAHSRTQAVQLKEQDLNRGGKME